MSLELRNKQVMIRVGEIRSLLNEIEDPKSNLRKSYLPPSATITFDKLVLSGPSVGSAACTIAAQLDKRIKALYLLDTWN